MREPIEEKQPEARPEPERREGKIRWGYLAPRVLVAVTLILMLEWGGGWFVGRLIVRFLDRMPHVSVATDGVRAGLISGRFGADNVQIGVEQGGTLHRVAADRIELRISRRQLLLRKLVVEQAELRGLRFETSDSMPDDSDSTSEWSDRAKQIVSTAGTRTKEMLRGWSREQGDKLEQLIISQSETARVAQQIEAGWRLRFDRWKESAAMWKEELDRIERTWKRVENASTSQQIVQLAPLVPRIQSLLEDLERARGEARQLDNIWKSDRRALEEAKRSDMRRLKQVTSLSAFDGESMARALLGEAALAKLDLARRWLDRFQKLRSVVAFKPVANQLGRRGRDIPFDRSNIPAWWIRRLAVSGQIGAAAEAAPFQGVFLDWSSDPALIDQPLRGVVRAGGAAPSRIRWRWDARTKEPVYHLDVHFDSWKLTDANWSIGDDVAWRLGEGQGEAWFWSTNEGNSTRSRLSLRLSGVRSTIEIGTLASLLKQDSIELSPRESISVEMEWSGDGLGRRMAGAMEFRTNLGKLLKRPLEQAVATAIDRQREQAMTELAKQQQATIARIEGELGKQLERIDARAAVLQPIYEKLKLDPRSAMRNLRLWR